MRDAQVLVTGATGFLGTHLIQRLLADGARVHALVRPDSPRRKDLAADTRVTCLLADLRDEAALDACLTATSPDVVFHLGAVTAGRRRADAVGSAAVLESYEVNVTGTVRLLLALGRAHSSATVVRTGGLEEYGTGPLPYVETQREAPVSPYSATQTAATHLGHALARQVGVPFVTIRPALTYGPGQSATFLIPALIAACLRGQSFDMTRGEQTRDLIYVDDVVEALVAAATARVADRIVNVGSGLEYRMRDVAELIVRLTGAVGQVRIGALPDRPGDLPRLVCDPQLARELLDWQATTSLEDGLARTIAAYRRQASDAGA